MKKIKDILVIPDLHINEKREEAWTLGFCEIFEKIKGKKFSQVILLGDIYDKSPTIKERLLFAEFIKTLLELAKSIVIIRGTGKHAYTKEIYHCDDVSILLPNVSNVKDFELSNYKFIHAEVKGTRYINGKLSESQLEFDKNKIVIAGHVHQPELSFDNVHYVGSVYKNSFSEIRDKKRILIIEDDKLNFIPIESLPMYEIQLIGKEGKISSKGLKQIKEGYSKDKVIDLKIKAESDKQTLGAIHRTISKIKSSYKIEYYKQEINITDTKVDVPKNLNQKELLKSYCELKKVDYKLIEKEL